MTKYKNNRSNESENLVSKINYGRYNSYYKCPFQNIIEAEHELESIRIILIIYIYIPSVSHDQVESLMVKLDHRRRKDRRHDQENSF